MKLNYSYFFISSQIKENIFIRTKTMNNTTVKYQENISDYIEIPIFSLIILLASFYIIFILSQKTFRTKKFNWLTMNICFANLNLSVLQIFPTIIRLLNIDETTVSCRVRGFLIDLSACYIMYSHCITSNCRLLSIRYPSKACFRSSIWLISNIVFTVIISIIIALPFLFFDGFDCTLTDSSRFLQIYSSISTMLLPIVLTILCNIAIIRFIRRSTKRVQDLNKKSPNRLNKRDMHLNKIFVLTFSIFVIGWLPLFIQQMFSNQQNQISSIVETILQLLPSFSILADSILIIYSDPSVRKSILEKCKCR